MADRRRHPAAALGIVPLRLPELLRVISRNLQSTVGHGAWSVHLSELLVINARSYRYFSQDDNSGRLMTQTLATLPPSQRAPYTRLQSSIRSAFHRSVNARRTAEFRAHLSATQPGGSLMPHSRANPHGSAAKKGEEAQL